MPIALLSAALGARYDLSIYVGARVWSEFVDRLHALADVLDELLGAAKPCEPGGPAERPLGGRSGAEVLGGGCAVAGFRFKDSEIVVSDLSGQRIVGAGQGLGVRVSSFAVFAELGIAVSEVHEGELAVRGARPLVADPREELRGRRKPLRCQLEPSRAEGGLGLAELPSSVPAGSEGERADADHGEYRSRELALMLSCIVEEASAQRQELVGFL